FHLHTPPAEIVRAIRVVLRRGSLRAAEEQTGHDYETIAEWIRRIGEHAAAVTAVLVRGPGPPEGEGGAVLSVVGAKGGAARGGGAKRPSGGRGERGGGGRGERGAGEPLRGGLGERAARRDAGRSDRDDDPRPDRPVGDAHVRDRRLGGVRDGGQAGVLGAEGI